MIEPDVDGVGVGEPVLIAVGMALSGHPPHRSVGADFPHTALTSDDDMRTADRDKDAVSSGLAASRHKGG